MALDFNLYDVDNSKPLLNEDLLAFAQEIEVLLSTGISDVIACNDDDWIDLESAVFKFRMNEKMMQQKIYESISKNCSLASTFRYEVTVEFTKGTIDDICLISTRIYENNDDGEQRNSKVLNLIIS